MCIFSCDRFIQTVESKIEKHKQDFNRSPEFIVISKEYYECFIFYKIKTEPGSNIFIKQFQGINLVLIPGRKILEMVGSPVDMFFYQLRQDKK
ncbi:hypothetical protein COO91_03414 [Nostoc flagelliforme CCNUN1]|uniref:Uncharacterized protein n=1 Tax=Nostoc flagelliforme CCNUN1 TaxID=2038116 RepID=A0A2K8SPT6_9NOSO|nr:hypothetical protein [Nostoc flagelliforme]AUB37469.1 hypothetical protein COO91_03414 [Nostoc flagelliforme CCNUN1]